MEFVVPGLVAANEIFKLSLLATALSCP